MPEISVTLVRGSALSDHLDALAALRLRVFREWPYLYEGDAAYESQYLSTYARCPEAIVVLAMDGPDVVGASTALPLRHEPAELQEPFTAHGIAASDVFYFGESVLLPAYRGRGIGRRFMEEREKEARRTGHRWAAFCAVERAENDPRRPPGFKSLHAFWRKSGFERQPGVRTTFSWKEIGEAAESPKTMVFWTKFLGQPQPQSPDA